MAFLKILTLVFLLGYFGPAPVMSNRVVCYYGGWVNIDMNSVDANLCTHLIYSFALLNGQNYEIIANEAANYGKVTALKDRNPKLKVLLAVGGWNEGSVKYSQMASSKKNRKSFIDSSLAVVKKYNFDGIDMDWEYPAQRGGESSDKANFASLMLEMRNAFGSELLLTAAVGASVDKIDLSYDLKKLSKSLDFINLMTYDLAGPWDGKTGIHSALYPQPTGSAAEKKLAVDEIMKGWVSSGMTKDMLVMGIPTYARFFKLKDQNNDGIGAPIIYGEAISYDKLCTKINNGGFKISRNKYAVSPYAVNGQFWYGYDDPKSAEEKGKYVKSNGYGGVMFWSLEQDDVDGSCGQGKLPIIRQAKKGLGQDSGKNPDPPTRRPVVTRKPNPATKRPVVTKKPATSRPVVTKTSGKNRCNEKSYYCDSVNKQIYYQCFGIVPKRKKCPMNQVCRELPTSIFCR